MSEDLKNKTNTNNGSGNNKPVLGGTSLTGTEDDYDDEESASAVMGNSTGGTASGKNGSMPMGSSGGDPDDPGGSGSKDTSVPVLKKIGKKIRLRRKKDKQKTENRAKKALKTISFILGAFVTCWTPYHIIAIVASFCPTCINVHLYMLSYFLCYLNSPVNPFCYAAANQQFKNAFKRIMTGDLSLK